MTEFRLCKSVESGEGTNTALNEYFLSTFMQEDKTLIQEVDHIFMIEEVRRLKDVTY